MNVVLQVSLDIYAESERSLHVTLCCWNIRNITNCLLSLAFVVWKYQPALQYYDGDKLQLEDQRDLRPFPRIVHTEGQLEAIFGLNKSG